MRIFDIHCDTPFDMYRGRLSLDNDSTAVSLQTTDNYEKKIFVTAFWSDNKKSPQECFCEFLESSLYFDGQIREFSERAMLCRNACELSECFDSGKLGAIKAVEGAGLVCGDLDRVHILYEHGIRHILPLWGGSDFIGGAWDSGEGLTDFGKSFVRECESLGIILDASHMSEKSFWDMAETVDCPIIASHSDYKAISDHKRNLANWQLAEIIRRGGIVGINLCAEHISVEKYTGRDVTQGDDFIGDVARHIYYCLEKGGEKSLCLGCDFDGTKMSPQIPDAAYAVKIYDRIVSEGVPETVAKDIFFNNAFNFYKNNLK